MYISRDLEQWQQVLNFLRQGFAAGKEQDILMMLLTPDERDSLGLRLQIVKQLLDKKLSQREIQQNLNTSVATITRGSNLIKSIDPDFLQWVKTQLNVEN
ncbi:Trp operon repressor [Gallibacterium salpingitidis]|uniref:Trp operon repressor homolog n=1 Tax=Gallibacterium salpingitidis TaxID=505341 RepID=A0A1A7Q291_9PAST|nr:trp operon repressor [Gallibacterium salpingitidis]OBW96235.1 Trp operon repressor [Gallibacterium salpingitidis]OBX07623.1 Trp operon repressor [Gallibacterium salpingitidis]OBX08171.1 Trp operon repressor [Gallibacterium salpingitidis]WKS98851.1 trp operon repressor [Gallibacterium salpingitidis]